MVETVHQLDVWFCEWNTWDGKRKRCQAPEEALGYAQNFVSRGKDKGNRKGNGESARRSERRSEIGFVGRKEGKNGVGFLGGKIEGRNIKRTRESQGGIFDGKEGGMVDVEEEAKKRISEVVTTDFDIRDIEDGETTTAEKKRRKIIMERPEGNGEKEEKEENEEEKGREEKGEMEEGKKEEEGEEREKEGERERMEEKKERKEKMENKGNVDVVMMEPS